jgi:hypothetical protein
MARRPQMKFKTPPVFYGKSDEDALQWMERYESIGDYNRWTNDDKAHYFQMSLEDASLKWFKCTNLPQNWEDFGPDNPGLRTRFLQEFQQENYRVFQESKLRNRIQGLNEPATEYYYDVLNLCRSVDPNMSEESKVENLFRGLSPILVQRLYPLRLRNCAEFLAAVKIHTEADVMANRRSWSDSVLKKEYKEEKVPVAAVRPIESSLETKMNTMIELMKTFIEKQRTTPPPEDYLTRGQYNTARSRNGRPVCDYCKFTGHLARFCFKNPDSERYDPNWSYQGIRTQDVKKENDHHTINPIPIQPKLTITWWVNKNWKKTSRKKKKVLS